MKLRSCRCFEWLIGERSLVSSSDRSLSTCHNTETWREQLQVTGDEQATREHFEKLVLIEAVVGGLSGRFDFSNLDRCCPATVIIPIIYLASFYSMSIMRHALPDRPPALCKERSVPSVPVQQQCERRMQPTLQLT